MILEVSFDSAFGRICEVLGTDRQEDIAERLGVTQSTVSQTLKKRKRIPSSWLVALVRRYMANPEWILYGGDNPKKLRPDA